MCLEIMCLLIVNSKQTQQITEESILECIKAADIPLETEASDEEDNENQLERSCIVFVILTLDDCLNGLLRCRCVYLVISPTCKISYC